MTGKQLRNSILQWAIQGKLVPQDPNDEPASVLLERIREEKARLVKEKKIKRDKNETIIYRGEDNSYYEKTLATGSVKCIDDEIPFDIPESWAWCRLGEISTYAETKRKINASNADPYLWGLDLEDIERGGRLLKIKTVGERKAIGDKTIFSCGDILYSKLRPYLLKILIAPNDGICTPEIIPFSCYCHINHYYIVNFLKSQYVDDYINSVTYGVKMPRVSTETMTSLLVPLPPLTEQSRIDNKIKELTPFIERFGIASDSLNNLNEKLYNSIHKSILQEAIQGKLVPQLESEGTAEELLEEIRAEKQRLVKEGKLKKSALASESRIFRGDDNKYFEKTNNSIEDITNEIPFEIPDSWEWCRLGSLLNIWSARRVHEKDWRPFGIPFYRAREISKLAENGYVDNDLYIEQSQYDEYSKSGIPQIGDLMMTAVGTLGKSFVVEKNDPFYFKDGSVLCIGNLFQLNPYFLKIFFESQIFVNQYLSESDGTTVATLTMVRLNKYLIPIPPIGEQ